MVNKIFSFSFLFLFLFGSRLFAHCDGIDGPVVKAAADALQRKNVNLVLIWIQEKDEEEVIKAFESSLKIRLLSPEAKEFADKYFFETVVRLHRTGEGESYTGLKPAGRDLGPVIPLADLSIEEGSINELNHLLVNSVEEKLKKSFEDVTHLKDYDKSNVNEGRKFVESYVQFIHFAEKLYEVTKHSEEHAGSSDRINKH